RGFLNTAAPCRSRMSAPARPTRRRLGRSNPLFSEFAAGLQAGGPQDGYRGKCQLSSRFENLDVITLQENPIRYLETAFIGTDRVVCVASGCQCSSAGLPPSDAEGRRRVQRADSKPFTEAMNRRIRRMANLIFAVPKGGPSLPPLMVTRATRRMSACPRVRVT